MIPFISNAFDLFNLWVDSTDGKSSIVIIESSIRTIINVKFCTCMSNIRTGPSAASTYLSFDDIISDRMNNVLTYFCTKNKYNKQYWKFDCMFDKNDNDKPFIVIHSYHCYCNQSRQSFRIMRVQYLCCGFVC